MKVKNCFVCHIIKPLEDFYVHPKMGDGYLNKCKDCTKEQVKKREQILRNDKEWLKKERARARDKYVRLGYKDKHKPTKESKKLAISKYKEKFPEKYYAKLASQKLVRMEGYHVHHWSYNEEHYTDIIYVTIVEHALAHRYMIYDQERKMYRKIDTMELLDTKEQHEQYIKNLPF
jgi:hypothetical protein